MRKILFLWLLAFAVSAEAQINLKPLDFKERTLKNGLKVISLEDHSSPTVTVQVWYRVGSKDDPQGRSGFAHLFEHLMFKSTKNMKSEMLDRLTEDVGGWNNATTWGDYTNYYEVVPSNYLETLLWAEAERMVNLNVDEANFKSERDVVKEEFRFRVLNPPYGRLFYEIERKSFTVHPYKRPGIGSIEDLDAASIEDVRAFYDAFYRPENAILIVVGDFEQNQLDRLADKYFGRIEGKNTRIQRVAVEEPARVEEKRFTVTAPNVPLPAIAITYLAPRANDPDLPALEIAENILSGGESSRLYQKLIYKQQIAQEAAFYVDDRADKGLMVFYAIAASGKQIADVEKSLLAELKKIQTAPPTAAEIEKAKNQIITNALAGRETNDGKAAALGRAELLFGNAAEANKAIEKIRRVTAADVQRAMQKYFTDKNRVVIYYQNESVKGEGN
ncbi:MAG: insulinase family protein [Acidobacteriota bacterium]|nr:insulinase family protein [Acidobacteriota bacterium]